MEIYRYIIDYYAVPNAKITNDGHLINCTMLDIINEVPVYKHEFLSTDYQPMSAIENNKPENIEGYKWVYHKAHREKLDVMDKNLEFCERAELAFGKLDEKYPDIWEYLKWVVDNLIREEFQETLDAIEKKDIVKVIDGACDLQVLSANLPYKLFRKLLNQDPATSRANTKEAFGRVVNSNLKKLGGDFSAEFRADGKVLKPVGWVEPTFADLINEQ